MSMNLIIKGTFKNGKTRTIGVHSSKGLEYKNQFDSEDINFLNRIVEGGNNSFNYCIINNKFKKLELIFEGNYCNTKNKSIQFNEILENSLKRLSKQDFTNIINKVNRVINN